jgi:hypothetical protein
MSNSGSSTHTGRPQPGGVDTSCWRKRGIRKPDPPAHRGPHWRQMRARLEHQDRPYLQRLWADIGGEFHHVDRTRPLDRSLSSPHPNPRPLLLRVRATTPWRRRYFQNVTRRDQTALGDGVPPGRLRVTPVPPPVKGNPAIPERPIRQGHLWTLRAVRQRQRTPRTLSCRPRPQAAERTKAHLGGTAQACLICEHPGPSPLGRRRGRSAGLLPQHEHTPPRWIGVGRSKGQVHRLPDAKAGGCSPSGSTVTRFGRVRVRRSPTMTMVSSSTGG